MDRDGASRSAPSAPRRARARHELARRATENKERREIALTPDDVQAWLGVLNDTRLVLGTRLGVTEDEPDIDPDAPEARGYAIYYWLTRCRATSSTCCCEIVPTRVVACGKVAP